MTIVMMLVIMMTMISFDHANYDNDHPHVADDAEDGADQHANDDDDHDNDEADSLYISQGR